MALLILSITSKDFLRSHYQKFLIMACTPSQSIDFVTQLSQYVTTLSQTCHSSVTIRVHSTHIEIDCN